MFFRNNKLLTVLTLLGGLLGCEASFADSQNSSQTPANQLQEAKPPETKVVGRDESKTTNYSKHIKDLEFHRSLNGSAVFDVAFEENISNFAGYKTKVSQDGYTLTITFDDTTISDKWVSNIDTKVFNTIVDSIKILKDNGNVIFVIHSLDRIALSDFKEGNTFKFKIDRRNSRVEGFNVNEPITISFKDTPVQTVLQVLSEFAGLNLVVSSSVRGNVSIDLKNVPWNEVMNIVLVSKGLATKKMSSILYVATAAEIAAQEQLELQTKRSLENNATLVTEFIPLNYTTAQAAQTVITSMAKQNGGIMSPRGSITSDTRTNTLIVTDTEEKIPLIRNVINEIDVPNDQVLIEARIVEVTRTSGLELGFNYTVSHPSGVDVGLKTFGTASESDTVVASTAKLAYTLAGGLSLEMEIRALENESLANQVASPHLVVANNETAFIKDGQDVPYQQATASGAASVAFQEAVLELQVTPQIAPDGNIVMEVLVTKNSVGASSGKTSTGEDLPPIIDKREVTTKVMVKDGETVVIGGIYSKKQIETRNKIPFLGDIPYLGYLFSNTVIGDTDSELLIFITPKIIETKVQK
ncbi:type IV pilus secretin PilQ family protein [Francisella philomiragia]|uniref:Type IV pili secretin component n=1 Tax=Francisella philomiragia subsp. philomiragia (strain ATCC 25017 / CCUG 19701 / FSC 153 / O\|nr:secretin N-terminal domain-containing protein [Francisella philomiragia]AJI47881.1 type IV pilus secretin PilQ family protein [Francisella philomiragia]AJI48627.1 type IV pilus secretin PilQ family protein [Francisella philomiragia]MBK2020240.1 type IV pilus secretin PilQ family protein [Francisella philomiragia]MBK2031258.1 type IV pilus secretin PilQ family protein [Francisella philomiragia]MBK2264154.1 type IV pilus secretin PilQ family protein [Francisella philomiragia]